jgi:hypothetical protein
VCATAQGTGHTTRIALRKRRLLNDLPFAGRRSVSTGGDAPVSLRVDNRATLDAVRYFPRMVDFGDDERWTEDEIETEFPLGDGDAETEAFVECPYCGESNEVTLDPGSGSDQEYVEDCQVCCRPWLMHVRYTRDGTADIEVIRSDE